MSQNDIERFVSLEVWNEFKSRFRSPVTEASYKSDVMEFCCFAGKEFEKIDSNDVKKYYDHIKQRVEAGKISPLTMTKKFRELHSFAQMFDRDYFYPYLKHMSGERNLARFVPVGDMDALFEAAEDNLMVYTILTLMYRAGISSTEIIALDGEDDFVLYEEGAYAVLPGRREPCYIPQDAWNILLKYMDQREKRATLFYNSRGGRLNVMYISRMMKKYCMQAGIPQYSAEAVRNCCAFNLFSYGASQSQVADQMARTQQQIHRYRGIGYRGGLRKKTSDLVRIKIEMPPEI